MSKRGSRSAEFIGSFWNPSQHVAGRDLKRDTGWSVRAIAFARHRLREAEEMLSASTAGSRRRTLANQLKAQRLLHEATSVLQEVARSGHRAPASLTKAVAALMGRSKRESEAMQSLVRQEAISRPGRPPPKRRRKPPRKPKEPVVRCLDCFRQVRESELSAHIEGECDPSNKLEQCPSCGVFVRASNLEKHRVKHGRKGRTSNKKARRKSHKRPAKRRWRNARAARVGPAAQVRDQCEAETRIGKRCSRGTSVSLGGRSYCGQHASMLKVNRRRQHNRRNEPAGRGKITES